MIYREELQDAYWCEVCGALARRFYTIAGMIDDHAKWHDENGN